MEKEQRSSFRVKYWLVRQERIWYRESDEWKWTEWKDISKEYLGSEKSVVEAYKSMFSESDKRQLDDLLENGKPIQIGTSSLLNFISQTEWAFIRFVIIAEKTENNSGK